MTALTTAPTTHLRKGRDGWKAESRIRLDEKAADGKALELSISTYKFGPNLVTSATVSSVDGGFRTHRIYQDYSKRLAVDVDARCTDKNVARQHALVLTDRLAEVLAACTEQYATPTAA